MFGPGRRRDLPTEIARLDASRVLVNGDAHDQATISELTESPDGPTRSIVGVRPHVPTETVRHTLDIVDDFGSEVVVSVGGGSATGLAKTIALERDGARRIENSSNRSASDTPPP